MEAVPASLGLTEAEAAARLGTDGPNVIPASRELGWPRQLAAQLTHFFALMLWVAAGLAFVAGMAQLGAAIAVVVVVNGLFAFAQERGARRAANQLRGLLPRRARVRRDGRIHEIDAAGLVRDDLVVLGAGDRISADGVVVGARGLAIDASMLTGESDPVWPVVGDSVTAGTFVVAGEAEMVVARTGAATRLGAIAALTHDADTPTSPLTSELDHLVRVIATIALAVGVGFFAVAAAVGIGARDGFLFAVGVTVALVPEGLLPTVTLSLARGAQRMAAKRALVRHLDAVETLGSTTFICTDKTGTLTANEMVAVAVWTAAGLVTLDGAGYGPTASVDASDDDSRAAATAVALAAARCSTGSVVLVGGSWRPDGDPMEAALIALARRLGADIERDTVERPLRERVPFDAARRSMSVVIGDLLVVKGAPESVLARCSDDQGVLEVVDGLAAQGLRVLAVASGPATTPVGRSEELELLGLVGLHDPPRPAAAAAVAACRAAGVRLAMVTGDHPATALAIAREVGLSDSTRVVDGQALPDDDAVLGALIDHDGVVISRVEPEDKLRITRALQERGHIVAMTGDGVNDGPALQQADIGVAMGRAGTDVAREAADLVLLDDSFGTIVDAIAEGRATFANIRRFLTYHLTDNVAELTPFVVWALSGGRFPLALGVLQILCLDIGTDLLPALGLGAEPPAADVLRRPPTSGRLVDRELLFRVFAVLGATEAVVEMAAFLTGLWLAGWRPGIELGPTALATASGAAFTAVVLGQLANAFACRSSTRPVWALAWGTNRLLVGAVAVEIAALVLFLQVHPVATALEHRAPALLAVVVAVAAAPAVAVTDGLYKRWRRQTGPSGSADGHGPAHQRAAAR